MAKGKNTVAAVWELSEPFAQQMNLSIWDVRFLKEGSDWYLRIFIDKDGGVSIDDCADFSRAIDKALDELDPIEQAYFLEVCSPGLERDLVRDEHFLAYVGEKIKVKMIRPVEGKREFNGILESYDEGNITVRMSDETALTFTKKEASWIKADDFDI